MCIDGARLYEDSQYALNCRETYIKADVNESPNDRNDRAIRVAAAWYMRRVPGMPIIVLTNDIENRRKAMEMGINAMSVQVDTLLRQHYFPLQPGQLASLLCHLSQIWQSLRQCSDRWTPYLLATSQDCSQDS